MMENVTLRSMLEKDCPQVSRIVCDSFRWGGEREGIPEEKIRHYFSQRGSEEAIREQFREYQCTVACSGKIIVGVIAVEENEITKLYIDPKRIRQGIGTRLFQAAQHIIIQAGYKDIVLGTIFGSSITFYEAMGMSKVGRKSVVCGPFEGWDCTVLKKMLSPR